ncbi:unnamed protein product [Oppiella nova]|uniref:PDZ domain-containing protein n=1 Tax=Oppiella nova TaxID=334625 RepID=A0A7R9QPK9_9ACAR|nr:unnamed protein product [Oppiella nova]CAG2170940.1 unnamed protein product [Oppiella nova]
MQRTNGRGVFITYVQPNSIAGQHKNIAQGDQILEINGQNQPNSIAGQHKNIAQGDQILEINGQNVRESNQKDVSQTLCSLDGAIVLLLGRVPSLSDSIREWARRKAQIFLRARTSTWSSSVGNCAVEKLQTQRPSLPVNKDKSYFQMKSPDSDIMSVPGLPMLMCQTINNSMTDITNEQQLWSRSSSLRSQKRLSVVAEDSKMRESLDSNAEEQELEPMIDHSQPPPQSLSTDSPDNPLLPAIKVTEF